MRSIITVLFILSVSLCGNGASADQHNVAYTLLEVEDGDTLLLEIEGQPVRVQLLGINAPEDSENPKFKLDLAKTGFSKQQLLALGAEATRHLKSMSMVGESLVLEGDIDARDRYGRLPARLSNLQGHSLAEDMVLDGYAVALVDESLTPAYAARLNRLERFSIKAGNGLWKSHSPTFYDWYSRAR